MADEILYVTEEELKALPLYPASTGGPFEEVPVGTLWRRHDRVGDPWLIGEWTGKVGQGVRILWKEARICTIQERIRMIREEKLGEFSSAFDVERKAMQEMIRELQVKNIAVAQEGNLKDRELAKLRTFKQNMVEQALYRMTVKPTEAVQRAQVEAMKGTKRQLIANDPLFLLNAKLVALENLFEVIDETLKRDIPLTEKSLVLIEAYKRCTPYF